jgi:hypothetical protein
MFLSFHPPSPQSTQVTIATEVDVALFSITALHIAVTMIYQSARSGGGCLSGSDRGEAVLINGRSCGKALEGEKRCPA